MLKRIIPCLDVAQGRVVKGTSFVNLKDAGDPLELAQFYEKQGADELVFLDISASIEGRKTTLETVRQTAQNIKIPLTVGGGIASLADMQKVFEAGATKVSLSTAAVKNPSLIEKAAQKYGSASIVVAIDAKYNEARKSWDVYIAGGQQKTDLDALEWAKEVERLGAGEILLTSIDEDGRKEGYDLELLKRATQNISIPLIASGGAGKKEDFAQAFTKTGVSACLAASVFHWQEISLPDLKSYLKEKGVSVRWEK